MSWYLCKLIHCIGENMANTTTVVENDVKKNRSQNRMRFIWPAWFAVDKQLHILPFCFANGIFFWGGGA